jgi:hypothetical protein
MERGGREALLDREGSGGHLVEVIGLSGKCDVLLDVRPFQLQLVGSDKQALEQEGKHLSQDEGASEDQRRRSEGELVGADPQIGP